MLALDLDGFWTLALDFSGFGALALRTLALDFSL